MTYTLSDLLVDALTDLGGINISEATGGSSTTVVDTAIANSGDDGSWKNGLIVVTQTTDGEAPEGEFKTTTAFTGSSGTFTFYAMTAAVEDGDIYGYTSPQWQLQQMIQIANRGLSNLGTIGQVDNTTLDAATDKTEYSTAVAWQRTPPMRIQVQTNTTNSDDNAWVDIVEWQYVPAAAGEQGKIILALQPEYTGDLQIWYLARHPKLTNFDDVIHESISPELAVASTVEAALRWLNTRNRGGEDFMLQRWNDAKVALNEARVRYPTYRPIRRTKLFTIGDEGASYPGDRNPR
ncbi:MAG: hypothetical protein DRJ03_16500 [Chloroflexi bacterium]|nr:MAG: hypothetical protein DRJ03_16500 [Chloroflexota bacterium]